MIIDLNMHRQIRSLAQEQPYDHEDSIFYFILNLSLCFWFFLNCRFYFGAFGSGGKTLEENMDPFMAGLKPTSPDAKSGAFH